MKHRFQYAKRLIGALFFSILSLSVTAQEETPEMADVMRSNGKIYVVVLVLATIFAGLIIYLVRLDRKSVNLKKASNFLQ